MFDLETLGVSVARMAAHDAFDALWKRKLFSRSAAYARLAKHMHLSPDQCHIKMFTVAQCKETIKWALSHAARE